jgi:hypothetical protein
MVAYSTITLVIPSRWLVSAKSTYFLINAIYLNNKMRNYLTEKAESSLPLMPITTTSSKISDALLSV